MAEFQSEPVKCTLSGSGFPGLARQQHLAGLAGSITEALPAWGKAEQGRVLKTPGVGKGGAGSWQHQTISYGFYLFCGVTCRAALCSYNVLKEQKPIQHG